MNYEFVLAYDAYDLYDFAFSQLDSSNRASKARLSRSRMREFYERIVLNRRVGFPLKAFLGKRQAKRRAKEIFGQFKGDSAGDTRCIILLADQLRYERHGLVDAIKQLDPSVKVVVYFCDLISLNADKQNVLSSKRNGVDLFLSFDKGEACRYGISHHFIPFSPVEDSFIDQSIEYDVCFVGKAKDRLSDLLESLETLNELGMRCFFYITGVDPSDRIELDGLVYGEGLSYRQYLEYVSRSRCLLEIVQQGSSDSTIRLAESIAFGKHLLSNSINLTNSELYDPERMHFFSNPTEIGVAVKGCKDLGVRPYSARVAPEAFLDDIANLLSHQHVDKCSLSC